MKHKLKYRYCACHLHLVYVNNRLDVRVDHHQHHWRLDLIAHNLVREWTVNKGTRLRKLTSPSVQRG